jgi:hypothetical protein
VKPSKTAQLTLRGHNLVRTERGELKVHADEKDSAFSRRREMLVIHCEL